MPAKVRQRQQSDFVPYRITISFRQNLLATIFFLFLDPVSTMCGINWLKSGKKMQTCTQLLAQGLSSRNEAVQDQNSVFFVLKKNCIAFKEIIVSFFSRKYHLEAESTHTHTHTLFYRDLNLCVVKKVQFAQKHHHRQFLRHQKSSSFAILLTIRQEI